jgi:acetyl esterase/lipase
MSEKCETTMSMSISAANPHSEHTRRGVRLFAALLLGLLALASGPSISTARAGASSMPARPTETRALAQPAFIPYGCAWLPSGVTSCPDIWYATVPVKNGWRYLYMNLWLPTTRTGLDPLLIYIPGGGYLNGARANCPGEIVAAMNYAMACIDYRHSDEATFPAQIWDVKQAVRALRAYAPWYGLDPARFGAWGDSAGGHLAALLGTSGGVAELEGSGGYLGYSSRVQAVVDWFGLTDFTQVKPAVETQMTWPIPNDVWAANQGLPWYTYTVVTNLLLGGPVSQHLDLARQANPMTWVDPTDPPFFILHGEQDTIVPVEQSQILADALGASGVAVTLIRDDWRGHSPSDRDGSGYGPQTIEQAVSFFDTVLHGRQ